MLAGIEILITCTKNDWIFTETPVVPNEFSENNEPLQEIGVYGTGRGATVSVFFSYKDRFLK